MKDRILESKKSIFVISGLSILFGGIILFVAFAMNQFQLDAFQVGEDRPWYRLVLVER